MIMRRRVHPAVFFVRQSAMRKKMAAMRAAKARKRQAMAEAGLLEREPKMVRWHRFEYGVRDKMSGETHWRDLTSIRQAAKALGLIMKFCMEPPV